MGDIDRPGEPGERRPVGAGRSGRLAEPPSARYRTPADGSGGVDGADGRDRRGAGRRGGAGWALATSIIVAALGGILLVLVGAVFASTAGLLFVSGVTGAGIGLALARAAVGTPVAPPSMPRTAVVRGAVVIAVAAVAVANVAIWLYARSEGGTLGLLDYLWTTFGPFVPGEAILAALAAAWGGASGPIKG